MHSFLELICYYNCDEPLDEDWIEERWFRQSQRLKERPRMTWKNNDIAEQVFHEIEPKEPRTYSSLIRGMCKYYQVEKGVSIFNDCVAKKIDLDVEAYNAIICVGPNIKESAELLWTYIKDILSLMKERNVDPNLTTMNNCLFAISQMGVKSARSYALSILAEFKKIGIEPSLASYAFIIQTFCNDRNDPSHVFLSIMKEIEDKEFTIRDIRDTHFFTIAMENCRHHIFNADAAKRLNKLLHLGENYNLIGDSYKESSYYRYFFSLLIQTEPLETFMNEYYHILVPHVYIPEPSVMEEILRAIEGNGAIEHIPLIWSHMICFEQISRENQLNSVVRIMVQNKPQGDLEKQAKINEDFAKIAWDIWSKVEEKNELRSKQIVWTGKILGDLMRLITRSQDLDKASILMEKILKEQNKMLGEPDFETLEEYVQLCIVKKQPTKAILCLQYSTEINHHESNNLARQICKEFTLDEDYLSKISHLIGKESLQEILEEIEKEEEEKRSVKKNELN